MNIKEKFCRSVIYNSADLSICKICSSSEDLHMFLRDICKSDDEYELFIELNSVNKKSLIKGLKDYNFEEEFHYFEIEENGQIVFKAYDGFEIGEVSLTSKLSELLKEFIDNNMCILF